MMEYANELYLKVYTNSLISNSVLLSAVLGNAFSKSALTLRVAWGKAFSMASNRLVPSTFCSSSMFSVVTSSLSSERKVATFPSPQTKALWQNHCPHPLFDSCVNPLLHLQGLW